MKFNGATFNKAQQDQLKKKVGAELDEVIKKVEDVDARMLNYTGDWVTGNEYHENDVVTWGTDGHLYEVIKAHTSSSTIDPSNTEYYKAMTARKFQSIKGTIDNSGFFSISIWNKITAEKSRGAYLALTISGSTKPLNFLITHVEKTIGFAYCLGCNAGSETKLYFAKITPSTEHRTRLEDNIIRIWEKNSNGQIVTTSTTASGFEFYYES